MRPVLNLSSCWPDVSYQAIFNVSLITEVTCRHGLCQISCTPVRFSIFSKRYFTQVTNSKSGCLAPADIELFIPFTQRLVEINCRFMKLFWAGLWLSLLREQNQIATSQLWLVQFGRGRKKEISKPSNTANHNWWIKSVCIKQSLKKAQHTRGLSLQQRRWEHKFLKYSWPNFSSKTPPKKT